jgi:U1 small nuclear ribonucleoprotein 70kDa
MEAALATFDPKSDPNTAGTDPMRTLFVSRLDFKTTESELYTEFEKHGAIRELKLVRTPEGKSRGYAFIEYQHSGDMKKAYKAYPDGSVRIGASERKSIVDVERGRTVEGWCVCSSFMRCILRAVLCMMPAAQCTAHAV